MASNDIVSVIIQAVGANTVIGQLRQVTEEIQKSEKAAIALGTTLVATATGVSIASVHQYEQFERFRRSLQTTYGDTLGADLAAQIQEFTLEANTATESLTGFATMWASMVQNGERDMMPMIRAINTASQATGATADETYRLGRALAQIRGAGVVRAQEVNQLIDAKAPIAQVLQQLGLDSAQDLYGLDAMKFQKAFLDAMESVQQKPLLVSQRLANTFETLMAALVPTGELFSKMATPLAVIVDTLVTWFYEANKFTRGWLGLIIVGGMLTTGFYVLLRAALRAAAALTTVGAGRVAGGVAGGAAAAGAGGVIAGILAKLGALVDAILVFWHWTLPVIIAPFAKTIGAVVLALTALAAIAIYLTHGLSNIMQGKPFHEGMEEQLGRVRMNPSEWFRESKPAAEQPVRRNSIENVWHKAQARGMAI